MEIRWADRAHELDEKVTFEKNYPACRNEYNFLNKKV